MIISVIEEAVAAGSRRRAACAVLGVSARMVCSSAGSGAAREGKPGDMRRGPQTAPGNKLSATERARALEVVNSPEFRDLSPNQIVPCLADAGRYIGSESTLYRILREEQLLAHRSRAKPPERRGPNAHVATGANQLWSWDITYLLTPVRGQFFYLYLILDIWSRKIVGWDLHLEESADAAAALVCRTCQELRLAPHGIVLHADNGGPMKGATMVATLERLGVLASFSRPGVSDDNPFSESLFKTMKYRPEYPHGPFADVAAARAWVVAFVRWYNTMHRHSAIRFVTPEDRHSGREARLLARRRTVYATARAQHPQRWTTTTRNWDPVAEVRLNPPKAGPARTGTQAAAA